MSSVLRQMDMSSLRLGALTSFPSFFLLSLPFFIFYYFEFPIIYRGR